LQHPRACFRRRRGRFAGGQCRRLQPSSPRRLSRDPSIASSPSTPVVHATSGVFVGGWNDMPEIDPRILLLGWDGADWNTLHPLLAAGKMPVLQRLLAQGVAG